MKEEEKSGIVGCHEHQTLEFSSFWKLTVKKTHPIFWP